MMKKYIFLLPVVITALAGCNKRDDRLFVLFTNDVHGGIGYNESAGKVLSYASVAKMKQDLKDAGKKVLLFDCGDHTSGGFYCGYLKGVPIVSIMNQVGYDAAVFGNHEFDRGFDYVEQYETLAKYPYISTNLYHAIDNEVTTPYTNTSYIFNMGNIKVGVIGVTTPYTMSTSTPTFFKDKDGHWLYSFLAGGEDEGKLLFNTVQKEIDMLHNEKKCTYVICLSHLGENESDTPDYTSQDLIKNTTGIDVLLDGHTHSVVPETFCKNKNNEDVLVCQTGSHMENIGQLTITSKKEMHTQLISSYDGKNEEIAQAEDKLIKKTDKDFDADLATSGIEFIARGSDGWTVRKQETNLGDFCADAFYYYFNELVDDDNVKCDVSFVNSGGVRSNVSPGTWKLKNCREVHSFDKVGVVKKVKGSVIKTYLEFATRNIDSATEPTVEYGALPQTQGIKFKVDVGTESDIQVDEKGAYKSGPTEAGERVSEIQIYNKQNHVYENIDVNKEYYIASSNYVIEEYGDGCTMFDKDDQETVYRTADEDFRILAAYAQNGFNSVLNNSSDLPLISTDTSKLKEKYTDISIDYEYPNGSGRMSLINTKNDYENLIESNYMNIIANS